jgi:hypothetical protein
MVNNFKQIRGLLRFENLNDYYFIEVLKRRKDNPRLNVNSRFIKAYYIFSFAEFDAMKDEILCTCEVAHARAYIRLNIRNSHATALHTIKRLADMIASNNTRGSINLYANSSSEQHSDPNVKFLVDIDSHEDLVFSKSVITELFVQSIDPKPGRIISEISTPNGIHLITTPFEINKFRESCPTISVYKDAPTVLYSPVSVTDSTCEIPI